jgi:hypothetical protein
MWLNYGVQALQFRPQSAHCQPNPMHVLRGRKSADLSLHEMQIWSKREGLHGTTNTFSLLN